MARTAQDVLEFDKLRELLRQRTTCVPGRRAVNSLEPGTQRAQLESAFALIREAAEWLRAGRELGFGALADPQGWLERIEGPGMVLEPGEFLDAASLLETASWLRQQFREESAKFPLLATKALRLVIFATCTRRFGAACFRTARSATTRQPRCGAFEQTLPRRGTPSREV